MDWETVKIIVNGGVGMVGMIVVLLLWRYDRQKSERAWLQHCKEAQEIWKTICDDKRLLIVADQETREAHIKALNELTLYLKTMNGKLTDIAVWEQVKYGRRVEEKKEGTH